MRLQRLEISGFKSFPDRADLHFDSGVTAIVGPNGCGKSNLVDAITWVLGEQSARSLRGDRMEDVIFCGSDARRPTAAAEVKLRLTGVAAAHVNGDLVEEPELPTDGNGSHLVRDVEVSRRLYRSGESEYLIDGHVVRLRDVQDLLMDAGVGVKAYAVIEQGKIGQILGAKPADRRQLIEEAAGVTKYKSRRRVAELKLEAAQQNLTRVDDIVFELEKQRGALKRQAAKARRYRRLREELRHWEKVSFARRYRALDDTLARARERLTTAQEREAALAAAVAAAEASVERVRLELAEAESGATGARERAHQQELENERRQQQLEFDRLQLEQLAASVVSLGDEVAKLDARLAPAAAELDERRESSVRADRERDAAAERVAAEEADTAAAQQHIGALEADVDAARHEVYTGLQSIATLNHAIDRTGEQDERVAHDLTRLDVEGSDLDAERARADAEQAAASSALRQAQDALERVRMARAACEADLAAARGARETSEREARAKDTEVAALDARLRSLEELDAARAAFGDAARLILSEPHADIAHAGAVADYVEVDPQWEAAVEASLGDLLQYVIVERREDVTGALGLLQARRAGRCGFLVAGESVGGERSAGPVDGAWPLSQVIRVGGRHRAAIEHAIDGVLVADSLARALAVSRAVDVPVVTPAGELVRAGCLVSGGGSRSCAFASHRNTRSSRRSARPSTRASRACGRSKPTWPRTPLKPTRGRRRS
jgi:chromosome segregation protein